MKISRQKVTGLVHLNNKLMDYARKWHLGQIIFKVGKFQIVDRQSMIPGGCFLEIVKQKTDACTGTGLYRIFYNDEYALHRNAVS